MSAAAAAASHSASLLKRGGLPLLTNVASNPYAPAGKWILGTAGMVVGMVHVGGLTRLTQSGLSMTDWSVVGTLPPLNRREWQTEFERYKQYPEWQQRQSMTLREFQYIYAWEYGHRMLGRCVGVAFVVPWLYFTARGKIPKGYQPRMVALLGMGASQGLVGWWMVRSGLGDDRRDDRREIRVKPVRLAVHLSMAVLTYGALLWTGLDLLSLPHKDVVDRIRQQLGADKALAAAFRRLSRIRTGSFALVGVTGITVASGALVAGNDAGRAYNTFPKMLQDRWIPSANELWELQPKWRNLVENTATVQLNHRLLGTVTATTALSLASYGLWNFPSSTASATKAAAAAVLTPQARRGLVAVGVAAVGQYALGVSALLYYVPISLAALHQLGSVALFTSGVYLAHSLRYAARPARIQQVGRAVVAAASAGAKSGNGGGAATVGRAAVSLPSK